MLEDKKNTLVPTEIVIISAKLETNKRNVGLVHYWKPLLFKKCTVNCTSGSGTQSFYRLIEGLLLLAVSILWLAF